MHRSKVDAVEILVNHGYNGWLSASKKATVPSTVARTGLYVQPCNSDSGGT